MKKRITRPDHHACADVCHVLIEQLASAIFDVDSKTGAPTTLVTTAFDKSRLK